MYGRQSLKWKPSHCWRTRKARITFHISQSVFAILIHFSMLVFVSLRPLIILLLLYQIVFWTSVFFTKWGDWVYTLLVHLLSLSVRIYCPPIIPGCLHLFPYNTWMYAFIGHLFYLDVCIYCRPIIPGCIHLMPTYYTWMYAFIAHIYPWMFTFIAQLLHLDGCIYCPPIIPGYLHLLPTYYTWMFAFIAYLTACRTACTPIVPVFSAHLFCLLIQPTSILIFSAHMFCLLQPTSCVLIYCLTVAPKPRFSAHL